MTLFDAGVFTLHVVVAAMAIALARRHAEHKPVAVFLAFEAVVDPIRFAVNAGPLSMRGPYHGWLRVLFHIDQLGFMAWAIGIAAVATAVFLRKRVRWTIAVGVLAWLALVATYPTTRGKLLGDIYAVIAGISVLWVAFCAGAWTRRREQPRPWHACTTLLGALNIPLFFGPFLPTAPNPFFENWDPAQVIFAVLWIALALVHMGALWARFMLSPSQRDS